MSEPDEIIRLLKQLHEEQVAAKERVIRYLMKAAEPHFVSPGFSLINHETTFKTKRIARFAKPITLHYVLASTRATLTYISDDEILFGRPYVPHQVSEFTIEELAKLVEHIATFGFHEKVEEII